MSSFDSGFQLSGRELPGRDLLTRPQAPSFPAPNPAFGDRITPLAVWERESRWTLPDETVLLSTPDRTATSLVVHCPLTRVPMTDRMMRIVGLDRLALQSMVDQTAPLGITEQDWSLATGSLFDALAKANLVDDNLIVKVGGSSTHGFSSRATALKKKRLPTNDEMHLDGITKLLVAKGAFDYNLAQIRLLRGANVLDQALRGLTRRPTSPWWGMMHRLGLEDPPDIDIQIYSPKVDAAMRSHPEIGHLVGGSRDADLWGRWPADAVHMQYEVLDNLQVFLGHRFRIDLEYLAGQSGRQRIENRQDWWTLHPRAPR